MTITNFKFPNYLGYAKAIRGSYQIDQLTGKETLSYEYKGQITLEVEVTPRNAKITEFFDGKILGISSDVNLKQAFFSHYRDIDPLNFAIHEHWMKSVIDIKNVYADYITRSCIMQLHYPSLFLIDVRVPIEDDRVSAAESLVNNNIIKRFQPWMQQAQFAITYAEKVDSFAISLLSFICPIAYALDAIQEVANSGLISRNKMFRPIVSLAQPVKGSRLRSFFGRNEDCWERYQIMFQASGDNF